MLSANTISVARIFDWGTLNPGNFSSVNSINLLFVVKVQLTTLHTSIHRTKNRLVHVEQLNCNCCLFADVALESEFNFWAFLRLEEECLQLSRSLVVTVECSSSSGCLRGNGKRNDNFSAGFSSTFICCSCLVQYFATRILPPTGWSWPVSANQPVKVLALHSLIFYHVYPIV